ncbi:hypothetical protein TrRE_jg1049, partial [Triparma retinervis]
ETCTENVHPFSRELWGINWCFAHNGDLPHFSHGQRPHLGRAFELGLRPATRFSPTAPTQPNTHQTPSKQGEGEGILPPPPLNRTPSFNYNEMSPAACKKKLNARRVFNPVGTTDSEAVFVEIMNAIANHFDVSSGLPSSASLYDFVKVLCVEIVEGGNEYARLGGKEESRVEGGMEDQLPIFNFLLCAGEGAQFAFSYPGRRPGSTVWNGLHYLVRKPPFAPASLIDCDVNVDFKDVTCEEDQVAVIATRPLTSDENWVEMEKGELILFEYGTPFGREGVTILSFCKIICFV